MSGPEIVEVVGGEAAADVVAGVAHHVGAGGVIAYPTETVYGFGALCTAAGVEAVRRVKPRASERPFLVLVPDAATVAGLAWTYEARELASIFWPGSLTLVLSDPEGIFPPGIRSPAGSVGVRVSPHPFVRALLGVLGRPLISTSANAPGEPPARRGSEVLEQARGRGVGDELLVVEAGTLPASASSTIVDLTGPRPRVLRAGAIPVGRLRCALPEIHDR